VILSGRGYDRCWKLVDWLLNVLSVISGLTVVLATFVTTWSFSTKIRALLLFAGKLARWIFPIFFSITLIFLCPTCSTSSTSTTQRTRPVSMASYSRGSVLLNDIELSPKTQLRIFATPRAQSVFISSVLAFLHPGFLLMGSGEFLLCCYIELSWSYRVVCCCEVVVTGVVVRCYSVIVGRSYGPSNC